MGRSFIRFLVLAASIALAAAAVTLAVVGPEVPYLLAYAQPETIALAGLFSAAAFVLHQLLVGEQGRPRLAVVDRLAFPAPQTGEPQPQASA